MSPDNQKPEPQAPLPESESESEARERLTEAFKREYPKLVNLAHRKLSPQGKDRWDEAEEIVVDALKNILERFRGVPVVGNLVGYWKQAVKNGVLSKYRRDDVRRLAHLTLNHELEKAAPSPESSCLHEERERVLWKATEVLRAKCRAAFRWAHWEDLSTKDVVARFATEGIEISERQVLRYIDEGYAVCRQALEDYEGRSIFQDSQKEGVR